MGANWLLLVHAILAIASFSSAMYARHCSQRASASCLPTKRMRDLEVATQELASSFDDLLESHKRLRSKEGMRDLRARRAAPPAAPETKGEMMRRIFGHAQGPGFAQAQLDLERSRANSQD